MLAILCMWFASVVVLWHCWLWHLSICPIYSEEIKVIIAVYCTNVNFHLTDKNLLLIWLFIFYQFCSMSVLLKFIYAQVSVCMSAFCIWLVGQYCIYNVVVQVIKVIFIVTCCGLFVLPFNTSDIMSVSYTHLTLPTIYSV